MRLDPETPAPAQPEPKLRPPKRAELLADNRSFVRLAGRLLHAFRDDNGTCVLCKAQRGAQHRQLAICGQLVKWRHATQYKVDEK